MTLLNGILLYLPNPLIMRIRFRVGDNLKVYIQPQLPRNTPGHTLLNTTSNLTDFDYRNYITIQFLANRVQYPHPPPEF